MRKLKQWRESLVIAFSMYSKIPMPKVEWDKDNMAYALCFFPWVGVVIALLSYGLVEGFKYLRSVGFVFQSNFMTVILVLIPVVITGGIHLDGLLDTADALSSYQSKEKRLEILKDPRSGAFAVITCATYFLLYFGAYSQMTTRSLPVILLGFVLSRSLSGLSIVLFPKAKGSGLAAAFASNSNKKVTEFVMWVYIGAISILMVIEGGYLGIAAVCTSVFVFYRYFMMSQKKFGGITGDLAGYFLQGCELWITVVVVVVDVIGSGLIL